MTRPDAAGWVRCGTVPYAIGFYADESGRKPTLDWIRDDLDVRTRRVLGTAMREILEQQGVGVCGTPFGRQLGGGLFEFRLRESELLLRVFCHAYGQRIVLLVQGCDKGVDPSALRQTREITEARRRLARWRQGHDMTPYGENAIMRVMTASINDFELLLAEAMAEGLAAMRDLRALQVKYRLINLLIERRHALQWTQQQLGVHPGIEQAEISKIERGRKSPTLDTYTRLVMALDLDDDILAAGRASAIAAR